MKKTSIKRKRNTVKRNPKEINSFFNSNFLKKERTELQQLFAFALFFLKTSPLRMIFIPFISQEIHRMDTTEDGAKKKK